LRQGLEVPTGLAESGLERGYRPSATFVPPSKDALTLELQGITHPNSSISAHDSFLGGGWAEAGPAGGGSPDRGPAGLGRRLPPAADEHHSVPSTSTLSKYEQAQNEALHRHLDQIEEEAAQAVAEKESFEEHLWRLSDEENKDASWRRTLAREHAEHLRWQMAEASERRVEGRQHVTEMASQHDFPSFKDAPEQAVYDYIRERQVHLKGDLDQQVDVKRRHRQLAKQQERALELSHIEAGKQELASMRLEVIDKQAQERAILHEAWERDGRMKAVRKTIEEHHKTPVTRANITGVLNSHGLSIAGSPGAGPTASAATPRSSGMGTPLSLGLGAMVSPRDIETPGSARLLTGSSRRVPFGAAASLALQKEKLRR